MSLVIFNLDTLHVSCINKSTFRSWQLWCWTATLPTEEQLSCASAGSPYSNLAELHPNSDTQQFKNNTANVEFQQHSCKLLKMDILMPETYWVSKKWSKYN